MSTPKNTPSKGTLSPRPYARLLTMIGDQLIKNEKIALFELIKNAYDADADWVQVRLINFEEERNEEGDLIEIKSNDNSSIEIEDDGNGMTWKVVSEAWMNPASPIKLLEKQKGNRRSPNKKRIIQGEKGIGRFAVFKIGSTVELITRSHLKDSDEIFLKSDLSGYDEETFTKKKESKVHFLDEIKYDYEILSKPRDIVERRILIHNIKEKRKPHGTIIRISNIKQGLDLKKLNEVIDDVNKLGSPFSENKKWDFRFDLLINGSSLYKESELKEKLSSIIDSAPLKVTEGSFEEDKFSFKLNGKQVELNLKRFIENKQFQKRFWNKKEGKFIRLPECGPFEFKFYVFDLDVDAPSKYRIDDKPTRDFIKEHRIYLYRDDIRVYPYGDHTDDWLGIDIKRGTQRAGNFLSNDQTIGYIGITNENNAKLKDKTNREGLLEIGKAYDDFIILIQTLLDYLHQQFTQYKIDNENKSTIKSLKSNQVTNQLEIFKEYLADKIEPAKKKEFDLLVKQYHAEKKYLIEKVETTEDLAAVGLTVEAASHDLMTMIGRAKETMDLLIKMSGSENVDIEKLRENLEKLRGGISFIEDQIKGIQPIFRSSRRRRKDHRVSTIIETAKKYYDTLLINYKIDFKIEEVGAPLVVKTNEAVLLQTFINLMDNAVYWLTTMDKKERKILIRIDGNKYEVVFADNGAGVSTDDEQYIFEPFFSTKGQQGRGLGLYIARQLLERNDFSIRYEKTKKILPGANFLVDFNSEEED